MRKLHLKFYLAIVGTLMVFLLAGAMVWHHLSSPHAALSGIESATGLAATMLDRDRSAGAQREVIAALAQTNCTPMSRCTTRTGVLLHSSGNDSPLTAAQIVGLGLADHAKRSDLQVWRSRTAATSSSIRGTHSCCTVCTWGCC